MDSENNQDYRLGFTMALVCMEFQTMFPSLMVSLAGFHVQLRQQEEICSHGGRWNVICDLVRTMVDS